MADPLSLTASIIALASAVKITIQGLERIIALKNAPALVLSISHEVSCLVLGTMMHSRLLGLFLRYPSSALYYK